MKEDINFLDVLIIYPMMIYCLKFAWFQIIGGGFQIPLAKAIQRCIQEEKLTDD